MFFQYLKEKDEIITTDKHFVNYIILVGSHKHRKRIKKRGKYDREKEK
jgi:hypothetical protein